MEPPGITLAAILRPSIILLDVDMPDMNGFEVCRQLKDKKETASIPILFLTAENGLKNKVKGLDLGAADYVTKPFNAEELSARIRATMRVGRQLEKSGGHRPRHGAVEPGVPVRASQGSAVAVVPDRIATVVHRGGR